MLSVNMLVAYWTADREALFAVFSDPGKLYVADPYTLLFASAMVLVFGAGLFSVDARNEEGLPVMGREAMTVISESRDEAQMIVSVLAGNTHEFHDLIRPYERRVYSMALSMLHNEADAEDAAQEAFLKAFRNLKGFRAESKFSTWLVSIVLNEARGRLRQKKKAMKIQSLDEGPDEQGQVLPALLRDWRELPSEALELQEVRSLLQRAITDLPLIYREIFLLREVQELTVAESAEALGITVASVKVRLHRARMTLQKTLAPQLKQFNPKRRWVPWL
jgi:RNA polymerase sigma-70 factor (ECF subfamily)